MKARNFSIMIIFLLCCSLCSGGQENSIGKSDPNIVQTESVEDNAADNEAGEHDMQETSVKGFDPNESQKKPIGYRAVKDKTGGHFLYIPIYEDGSEGMPKKYAPKKKSVFDPQSYFLATGLKRESLFIGPEIYHFEYEESGMQDKGMFYGVVFGYTYRGWIPDTDIEKLSADKVMFAMEFRFAAGEVDYDGELMSGTPYKMSNIDDKTFEARFLIGPDLLKEDHLSTFYTGFGYRYLYDDSSSDPAGYERISNYLYLPVGYQFHQITDVPWSIAATIEGDLLLLGVQKTDLGFLDVSNDQHTGLGFRTAVKLQKQSEDCIFSIEPFFRYWDIDDSETDNYFYEPANETTEFGIQFKWLF
jgi:hypothetical protein